MHHRDPLRITLPADHPARGNARPEDMTAPSPGRSGRDLALLDNRSLLTGAKRESRPTFARAGSRCPSVAQAAAMDTIRKKGIDSVPRSWCNRIDHTPCAVSTPRYSPVAWPVAVTARYVTPHLR